MLVIAAAVEVCLLISEYGLLSLAPSQLESGDVALSVDIQIQKVGVV